MTSLEPGGATLGTARRVGSRVLLAFLSPDSYGLLVGLIMVAFVLSVAISSQWAASVVLGVQIVTVWVALRASRARRAVRSTVGGVLVVSALVAVANLFFHDRIYGDRILPIMGGLLYLVASVSILRHLVLRHTIDREAMLGAIAIYLLFGMFFAFVYRSAGASQAAPFFGEQGDGTLSQDLFFSFTTLTTTGYGNLVPAANPGQTFALIEVLLGQVFLIGAVGKIVSGLRPGERGGGLRHPPGSLTE